MKRSSAAPADGEAMIEDLHRFRPEGLSLNAWAVAAGVNRSVWGDIRRHGNPSRGTLEKLLAAAGSSLAEFEALRVGGPIASPVDGPGGQVRSPASGWQSAPVPTVPRYAARPCGAVEADLASVDCFTLTAATGRCEIPSAFGAVPGTYTVDIIGTAMEPRFKQGRSILVQENGSFGPGDDVLIRVAKLPSCPSGGCFIAELLGSDAGKFHLRQHSPAIEFRLDRHCIDRIYLVLGEILNVPSRQNL